VAIAHSREELEPTANTTKGDVWEGASGGGSCGNGCLNNEDGRGGEVWKAPVVKGGEAVRVSKLEVSAKLVYVKRRQVNL